VTRKRRFLLPAVAAVLLAAPRPSAASAPSPRQAVLDDVNKVRAQAGLSAVVLDDALNEGAQRHADYLTMNRIRLETAGLGAHQENPATPGYTKEGASAGPHSVIVDAPPESAVAVWINSLYHRTPILAPSLRKVGFGWRSGPDGPMSVLAFDLSVPADPESAPVEYPTDGQTDVPLVFGPEIPDPVPGGVRPAGPVITLAFPSPAVRGVEARLTDAAGADVPFYLSSPEKPATSFPQGGVVCLIPKRPLRPAQSYVVAVEAEASGKRRRFRWTFTTAAPVPVDAGEPGAVDRLLGRLVRLTGDVRRVDEDAGRHYLQVGGAKSAPVALVVLDRSTAAFAAAGIDGLASYAGKRVEALGVPVRASTAAIGMEVYSPDELREIPFDPPLVDAEDPGLDASLGRLVRLRGRVLRAVAVPGYAVLVLGRSAGREVSAFVPEASWPSFATKVEDLAGLVVVVRGVPELQEGRFIRVEMQRPGQLEREEESAKPAALDAGDAEALDRSVGRRVLLTGDVRRTGSNRGRAFLDLAAPSGRRVWVFVADEARPAFADAGVADFSSYEGERVRAYGVLEHPDAQNYGVTVSTPAKLSVLALEPPRVDADSPELDRFVGTLARVSGRVRQARAVPGYVFLQIGESRGRMVSAFVSRADWAGFGLSLERLKGRRVVVRGVPELQDGKALNITVERPAQFEWSAEAAGREKEQKE